MPFPICHGNTTALRALPCQLGVCSSIVVLCPRHAVSPSQQRRLRWHQLAVLFWSLLTAESGEGRTDANSICPTPPSKFCLHRIPL